MHDHCYVDRPPPQKRRKLRRAKIKKATEAEEGVQLAKGGCDEAFSSMASHLVVRLVNSGHGDVAYNQVQHTVDQSTEERGRMVSEEAS